MLGLRGRRPVSADRHEPAPDSRTATWPTRTRCSSRRTSSSAVPGRPGCWWSSARCCATAFRRCRAAGRSCSSARRGQCYHPDPEIREEGGTPGIVESIRAGLAFALKDAVGSRRDPPPRARPRASRAGVLGARTRRSRSSAAPTPERLAIVSIGLRHAGRLLHANFVVAVLSDLFGIQARSGCFCAGPYIHRTVPDRRRVVGAHARRGRRTVTWAPSSPSPGSASTTTSARRRSPTSSTPSTCSPARAGSCCRSTASIPAAGLWHHRAAGPRPATCLRDALTDDPARLRTAPERVLAGQLEGGTPDHRRGAGAAADGSTRRPGAQRGVRAHSLVPAPGRGPRPPASRRRCLNDRVPPPERVAIATCDGALTPKPSTKHNRKVATMAQPAAYVALQDSAITLEIGGTAITPSASMRPAWTPGANPS